MKLSAGTIGTALFTVAGIAVFVLMAKRPGIDGSAMNFGMPLSSVAEEKMPEVAPVANTSPAEINESMPEASTPEATTLEEVVTPKVEPVKVEEVTTNSVTSIAAEEIVPTETKAEEMPIEIMPTDVPAANESMPTN